MSAYLEKFIDQLLKKIDKPEGVVLECRIRITDHAYSWYFALNNSVKTSLHQALESIVELDIEYQRKVSLGTFKHIEYIHITNGCRLMQSCGLTPKADEIKAALQRLEAAEFNVAWWNDVKPEIAQAWLRNKTFCGLKGQQIEPLFDAMKLVEVIVKAAEPVPDMRTLSAMLYGNSKKIETSGLSALVRRLMLPYLDSDVVELVADGGKLMEYFGIGKYPIPLRFRASGQLHCRGIIDLSALCYGIGVAPDEIKGIEWDQLPPYVLFIENHASFERYAREIHDGGVIIYTAGFPPRSWVRAMEIIVAELRDIVPFYHWGDRDVGGYRILVFLAKRLDTDIQPYLMGVDTQAQIQIDDKFEDISVADLMLALESARAYPAISALYDELTKQPLQSLPWIEQEQIAPVSPLSLL